MRLRVVLAGLLVVYSSADCVKPRPKSPSDDACDSLHGAPTTAAQKKLCATIAAGLDNSQQARVATIIGDERYACDEQAGSTVYLTHPPDNIDGFFFVNITLNPEDRILAHGRDEKIDYLCNVDLTCLAENGSVAGCHNPVGCCTAHGVK